MASMRDIKRRKGSIQSTQQITKAMKLVSVLHLFELRLELLDRLLQLRVRFVVDLFILCNLVRHLGIFRIYETRFYRETAEGETARGTVEGIF